MRYQPDRAGMGVFLRGPDARRITTLAAAAAAARMRRTVARRSGDTARSIRLVHTNRGGARGDRVAVSIVAGGAAVPLQWGNRHTRATRFMTAALAAS